MPADDTDRIPQKLRDLCRVILVPNPKDRPTIEQLQKLLLNWNELKQIKLSQSAIEIKAKNKDSNPSKGSKIKDLTYDDLAIMQ